MAYGSPNSMDEVREYLQHVRGGRTPTFEDVERLKERYKRVGGRTPLLDITTAQAQALEKLLGSQGLEVKVYVGMKHWHPFIAEAVEKIVQDKAGPVVGLALAPHYSKTSIGGYEDAVWKALDSQDRKVSFRMVKSYHAEPALIRALSKKVLEGLRTFSKPEKALVLFTAHSLPKASLGNDDPYQTRLLETSRLVAEKTGVRYYEFAFQSAGDPKLWLGPLIQEQLSKLKAKGFEEVLACPVGFVSDHLEILYDLDVETKEYARELGIRFERTRSLNDDSEFIEALASVAAPLLTPQASVVS